MTGTELSELLHEEGAPRFRGRQLFEWLWVHQIQSYAEISVWPIPLRRKMDQQHPFRRAHLIRQQAAPDGTKKLLLGLSDEQRVETVVLPHRYGDSVCISSQVGCAMGCKFCASGLRGRVRQLTAGEMMDQVVVANRLNADRVRHIDLMGIGEPLDNLAAVLRFLQLAHDPAGLNFSYRHVTVSTSGLVPAIQRLADSGLPVTLAVSLHAPTDALRLSLMPVNRAYPLQQLIPMCRYYVTKTGRRVTFEYLLLSHVNDGEEQAHQLGRLIKGFPNHVNLIPWNPVAEHPFQPSPKERVRRFQSIVQEYGISCTIRRELGQEIDAACGQLRLREEEPVSP
ncbi:MAG: 23S rRNA (adenine(2503)-C(2))-methyltransferase RlmN [Sulfobacillus acidophilus]|uniref:Probable dual-specificity RNA methyltransferase RlmN n=1 Tax=Sulfobacillus acidophilus TaxID=53633 RepID=A0A2T2WF14_9FIRM|nr:MAG: 23S rRNA (adenine(2503)-C(2))-methyltransferase RlmN [Sulfobacillus acidophilus]